MPQPEASLKCPRCESTDTKFCYFNNYSLSQPRHFCKTCRRYWTRGGALVHVPVGGGSRRNKQRKPSANSSKCAPSAAANRQDGTSSTSSKTTPTSLLAPQPPLSLFPFMASHSLRGYLSASITGLDHWRLPHIQQFPFLDQIEPLPAPAAQPVAGLYQFEEASGDGVFSGAGLPNVTSTSLITQMASVKIEDSAHSQGANSSHEFLGVSSKERYRVGAGLGGNGANPMPGTKEQVPAPKEPVRLSERLKPKKIH